MRINRTLRRLRAGETVLGCAMRGYRPIEIPRVFAAAGFDCFFIDLETAQDMIAAGAAAGITPDVILPTAGYLGSLLMPDGSTVDERLKNATLWRWLRERVAGTDWPRYCGKGPSCATIRYSLTCEERPS